MKLDKDKTYIIMIYYGYEGWKITGHADSFQEAIRLRDECLSWGNMDVALFKNVKYDVIERVDND